MPLKAPALAHDGRCTPPLCSACSTADLERNPSGRICCLFDLAGEHNTSATAMAHQAVCRAARQHHASCISTSLYRLSCCPARMSCVPLPCQACAPATWTSRHCWPSLSCCRQVVAEGAIAFACRPGGCGFGRARSLLARQGVLVRGAHCCCCVHLYCPLQDHYPERLDRQARASGCGSSLPACISFYCS